MWMNKEGGEQEMRKIKEESELSQRVERRKEGQTKMKRGFARPIYMKVQIGGTDIQPLRSVKSPAG